MSKFTSPVCHSEVVYYVNILLHKHHQRIHERQKRVDVFSSLFKNRAIVYYVFYGNVPDSYLKIKLEEFSSLSEILIINVLEGGKMFTN